MKRQVVYVILTLAYLGCAVPAGAALQGGDRVGRAGNPCLCGRDVDATNACFESRQCADAEPCNVNTDCNPTPGGYCIPDTLSGCDNPGFAGSCAMQTPTCPEPGEDSCAMGDEPTFPLDNCDEGFVFTSVPILGPFGMYGTVALGVMLLTAGLWAIRRRRSSAFRGMAAMLVLVGMGLVGLSVEYASVESKPCGRIESSVPPIHG